MSLTQIAVIEGRTIEAVNTRFEREATTKKLKAIILRQSSFRSIQKLEC